MNWKEFKEYIDKLLKEEGLSETVEIDRIEIFFPDVNVNLPRITTFKDKAGEFIIIE